MHEAQEGPLLNQRKGHADVLVHCGTSLMKMWHVESRLVSCTFQQCSSEQYAYTCQLVVVLQVMSSVDVYPMMHIFVGRKGWSDQIPASIWRGDARLARSRNLQFQPFGPEAIAVQERQHWSDL